MSRGSDTAYPVSIPASGGGYTRGMTIREAFAKAAMQGFLSNEDFTNMTLPEFTAYVIRATDALLAELEKTNG